ncbi:putative GEgh16 protein [Rosellinia necatrix]|uniref:Putative GEgh16 protein n=1 Tax=Rosellinia necatrix TaxID=77044 RepID=A0A1S7UMS1_ROSNE|nr:putative GEgh16 protein [Rosellinia necatrix]
MILIKQAIVTSALLAVAHGQAVLLAARGAKGSPVSLGLQVEATSPDDANFISDVEITTNVVNECGRTMLAGNIDIGEQTENALADGNVTQATAGSRVSVFIRQVNETGAGPFTCDMDLTGNSNGVTGQTQLRVREDSANGQGIIGLRVTMPSDMQCTGASTGNVCTVRCRNANNFGGCFAVQQTDVEPGVNDPTEIATIQQLEGVLKQVQQNIADLPAAMEAIAEASQDDQGTAVVEKIQAANPSTVDN